MASNSFQGTNSGVNFGNALLQGCLQPTTPSLFANRNAYFRHHSIYVSIINNYNTILWLVKLLNLAMHVNKINILF
jgi:hypothetical protein